MVAFNIFGNYFKKKYFAVTIQYRNNGTDIYESLRRLSILRIQLSRNFQITCLDL